MVHPLLTTHRGDIRIADLSATVTIWHYALLSDGIPTAKITAPSLKRLGLIYCFLLSLDNMKYNGGLINETAMSILLDWDEHCGAHLGTMPWRYAVAQRDLNTRRHACGTRQLPTTADTPPPTE